MIAKCLVTITEFWMNKVASFNILHFWISFLSIPTACGLNKKRRPKIILFPVFQKKLTLSSWSRYKRWSGFRLVGTQQAPSVTVGSRECRKELKVPWFVEFRWESIGNPQAPLKIFRMKIIHKIIIQNMSSK